MQASFATYHSRPMAAVAPLPLELVLSGRELTEPQLSPDGTLVAFVQRWRGSAAIVVVPSAAAIDGGVGRERLLSIGPDPAPGRGLGGGCFTWLPDSSGVVYAAVDGELWRQPLAGGPVRLTSMERSCRAPVVGTDGSAVVAVDEAEVWRITAVGGQERLDDGRHEFCFDPAIAPGGSVVSWLGWSPPDMPWDAAERVDLAAGEIVAWRPDGAAVQQPRFAGDGRPTHVDDSSGWLNVYVEGRNVLPEHAEHAGPTWGMGQRSFAAAPSGALVVARNRSGFGDLVASTGADRESVVVAAGVHGQLSVSQDGDVVALRSAPDQPPAVVRYEGAAIGAPSDPRVLASSAAIGWDAAELPRPEALEVAVDGVVLHARRYAAGAGRLLCWIHGGPTDQWQADFRPRIAYWWSRGWDVLAVDPRGSTGHGRVYQQALAGSWGRLDVDDTASLLAAAHRAGWARPDTTVVIGGSSGGLTVLGVLADHSELVAGGVASYPVSDLRALAAVTHRFEAHYTDTLVGPIGDGTRFDELSPLTRSDRIRSPLLVFHGTDDPVVPISQSEALVARVRAAGGNVDFVVYEGEGHGFRDPVNQRDEYERTERFLASIAG